MVAQRHHSFLDKVCIEMDHILRAVANNPKTTGRVYPAEGRVSSEMTPIEKRQVSGFMRVNHAGEICAQALYHGQRLASHHPLIRQKMQNAAIEEGDHLAWCQRRLNELGAHTSFLNPFWYSGSFLIGYIAGRMGDAWSLGFLAETETQVVKHLENHLRQLPIHDQRSEAILQQMKLDEHNHHHEAVDAGAITLPTVVQKIMRLTSQAMVKISYWI